MAKNFESGFKTILSSAFNPGDTEMKLAAVPTVTSGRIYIDNGAQVEWVSYDGIIGLELQNCVRNLSRTADPVTGGTGLTWIAGTTVRLVAMHDQLGDRTAAQSWEGDQEFNDDVEIGGELTFNGTTTAGLNLKSLTTTQRDALTPTTGMKIYNSTTGTEQTYYGGQWNDAGTSTVANATEAITGKVRLADQTQVDNGTDTEAGDPLVVIPSTLKVVTDAIGVDLTFLSSLVSNLKGIVFGDGSDGNVTIAGTVTLTRDMYYNNLEIPSGQILDPAGYRIFVKGTISGVGTIRRNGNDASGSTAGATLNQGSLNAEVAAGNGGAGGVSNAPGTAGTAGTSANPSITNINGVSGGAGGDGGQAGGGAGAGGTSTRGIAYNKTFFPSLFHPATAQTTFGGLNYKSIAGSGGGGGGGANPGSSGGNGGGAGGNGGFIRISAYIWNFTGAITHNGGAGGNGTAGTGTLAGGGAGGGGGNGGVLFRIYHTMTSDATITHTGGALGTGGAGIGGGNAGASGTVGNAGETISIVI